VVEHHQTPDIRAIKGGELIVRGCLRQQHELGSRREFREAAQQFQHENLGSAVFATGKDWRQIDQTRSQLRGIVGFQRLHRYCLFAEPGGPFRTNQPQYPLIIQKI
jgi:hypothetical protein